MSNPELVYVCEICQTLLDARQCKAICPNCGRMLDCSDLPAMPANARYDPDAGDFTFRTGSDLRDWLPTAKPNEEPESSIDEPPPSVQDLP